MAYLTKHTDDTLVQMLVEKHGRKTGVAELRKLLEKAPKSQEVLEDLVANADIVMRVADIPDRAQWNYEELHGELFNRGLVSRDVSPNQFIKKLEDEDRRTKTSLNTLPVGMARAARLYDLGLLRKAHSKDDATYVEYRQNAQEFTETTNHYVQELVAFRDLLEEQLANTGLYINDKQRSLLRQNQLDMFEADLQQQAEDDFAEDHDIRQIYDDLTVENEPSDLGESKIEWKLFEELMQRTIYDITHYVKEIEGYRNGYAPVPMLKLGLDVIEFLREEENLPRHPLHARLLGKISQEMKLNRWEEAQLDRFEQGYTFPKIPQDIRTMRRDDENNPLSHRLTQVTTGPKGEASAIRSYNKKSVDEIQKGKMTASEGLPVVKITDLARTTYLHDGTTEALNFVVNHIQEGATHLSKKRYGEVAIAHRRQLFDSGYDNQRDETDDWPVDC